MLVLMNWMQTICLTTTDATNNIEGDGIYGKQIVFTICLRPRAPSMGAI